MELNQGQQHHLESTGLKHFLFESNLYLYFNLWNILSIQIFEGCHIHIHPLLSLFDSSTFSSSYYSHSFALSLSLFSFLSPFFNVIKTTRCVESEKTSKPRIKGECRINFLEEICSSLKVLQGFIFEENV